MAIAIGIAHLPRGYALRYASQSGLVSLIVEIGGAVEWLWYLKAVVSYLSAVMWLHRAVIQCKSGGATCLYDFGFVQQWHCLW